MYASATLPSAGGAAESLAHHEVVGKREKESEPWRGGTRSQRSAGQDGLKNFGAWNREAVSLPHS